MKKLIALLVVFLAQNSFAALPLFSEGKMSSDTAVIAAPKAQVQASLPDYLELGEQDLVSANFHPVLLIFAKQTGAKLIGATDGINYNEMIVYIPNVRVKGQKKLFNYMAQLYLNELMPTYVGLRFYGYMKDVSVIDIDKFGNYSVKSLAGQPLLNMTAEPLSFTYSSYSEKWAKLKEMFNQPVVSNLNGKLICSEYTFNFSTDNQIKMHLNLDQDLFGISKGAQTLNWQIVNQFALHYEFDYTLSVPAPIEACLN